MDFNLAREVMTLVLFGVFVGIVAWAWTGSGERKRAFDAAARLPLEEDESEPESRSGRDQGART
jgi:cytochrome c oxidase cbb3-type subunit 4